MLNVYVCVCVGGWVGGEGGMGGGDLMPPSPVICIKSHGLLVRLEAHKLHLLAIRVYFLVYSSSSS